MHAYAANGASWRNRYLRMRTQLADLGATSLSRSRILQLLDLAKIRGSEADTSFLSARLQAFGLKMQGRMR